MRQTRYRLLVIFILSLGGVACITSSFAGQVHDQELAELEVVQDNLDLQKEWVQYRNDTQVRHCYQLFFVERCLDRVRQTYLKEIKVVRVQELAMHDRRREVNEMIKTDTTIIGYLNAKIGVIRSHLNSQLRRIITKISSS